MQGKKSVFNQIMKRAVALTAQMLLVLVWVVVNSETCYASGFNGEEANIGGIFQTLALSGGAVGLAWSGIEFACGDEQKSAKAKSRMIIIIIATAAVFALPAVIRNAQELFSAGAWSPDHLTTN